MYTCPIDKRPSVNDPENNEMFCIYHFKALKEIEKGFNEWNRRKENKISWHEYLKSLRDLKEQKKASVGDWSYEVIHYLIYNKKDS